MWKAGEGLLPKPAGSSGDVFNQRANGWFGFLYQWLVLLLDAQLFPSAAWGWHHPRPMQGVPPACPHGELGHWWQVSKATSQGLSSDKGLAPEPNGTLDKAVFKQVQSRIKVCHSFLLLCAVLPDEACLTQDIICACTAFVFPVVSARSGSGMH